MVFNESITINNTKNKYIFWDIDGTLAPYRFYNHVGDPNGSNNGMSIEEIEKGIFLERKPSKLMQKVIKECQAKENIIMSHCQIPKEVEDKEKWLDQYYPTIKERLLTFENIPKVQTILTYCEKHSIPFNQVLFVDDILPYLREAEKEGIEAWHISSFLDWDYQ